MFDIDAMIRRSARAQKIQGEGPDSYRAPFVGVGPGRCGTRTLVAMVEACDNAEAVHETYQSRWYEWDDPLDRLIERMDARIDSGIVFGEVQCQILPHVENLRRKMDGLKVVCLHRDREKVVRSYLTGFRPMLRPWDKSLFEAGSNWPYRWPTIDAASPRQAYEFWWEMYEEWMADIPEPVLHLQTDDFNNDAKLTELYQFLGIPGCDRAYPNVRHWNYYCTEPPGDGVPPALCYQDYLERMKPEADRFTT